ncbi:MAG: hypothetical protein IKR23_04070 [Lachnospiraceae bacterium]|nr:hypothetical protein [Lachnospiraceae bacterium]
MKKGTGIALLLMLLLCICMTCVLGFLLWQKNSEIDDLNSDLRRDNRTIEGYEEQIAEQQDAFSKEKQELEQKNQKLKDEKDQLTAQLKDAEDELAAREEHIPATENVVIDENVGRVYQSGYGEFCDANDTYDTRQYMFSTMYNYPTDVVFTGDSLVERGSWEELYPDLSVKNRGIGGDTINGLRVRIDTIMLTQPKKLFIYVGINDVLHGREVESILGRYGELFDVLDQYDCQIYIQGIMPVSSSQYDAERICLDVNEINERLREMVEDRGYTFIDLWSEFAGDDWALREEYYYDGVHVNAAAYRHWKEILDQYIYE